MDNGTFHGKFYVNGSFKELYITVEDGIITGMKQFQNVLPSKNVEGAILPGFTDIHVHFRDPGETEKEDFPSGSLSAAFGGTTTVFDMPNNIIPLRDYNQYERKKSVTMKRSSVDYGFYSLYDGSNGNIISNESAGLKIFMGESTNSSAFNRDYLNDDFLTNYEKPVVFHGEDGGCLKRNSSVDVKTLQDHNLSRPSNCERESLEIIAKIRSKTRIAAHISDFRNMEGFEGKFPVEMTPHHMLLNDEMNLGAYGKVNPPLRERKVADNNLQAFLNGRVDILSSDHAPHTEQEKDSIKFGKSGIIGVETRIPLMLAMVKKKILPLDTLVKVGAENPAEIFGLKKGKIDIGYYADFVAINFSNVKRLNENRLHSKNYITPFNNFDVVFPLSVFLRGEQIIENSELVADNIGNYLNFKGSQNS
jgi:dihydroorotase